MPEDKVLVFLNKVTPRIGPVAAANLFKDMRNNALEEMIKELGLPQAKIDAITKKHLEQVADNIMKTVPVVSPIQNRPF